MNSTYLDPINVINNALLLSGCGGTFHGYFGAFNLTQWSWDGGLDCSWRINNPGLTNPVMIISAQYVELKSCE